MKRTIKKKRAGKSKKLTLNIFKLAMFSSVCRSQIMAPYSRIG